MLTEPNERREVKDIRFESGGKESVLVEFCPALSYTPSSLTDEVELDFSRSEM